MKKIFTLLTSALLASSAMAADFVVTSTQIVNGKTGNSAELGTNKYGTQAVADTATWYSFKKDINFKACRICVATAENGGGIQMQGNASDAAKQGFLGNTDAFTKIEKMVVYARVAVGNVNAPNFHVYFGDAVRPAENAIVADTVMTSATDFRSYKLTYTVAAGAKYFEIKNDLVGALYIDSLTISGDLGFTPSNDNNGGNGGGGNTGGDTPTLNDVNTCANLIACYKAGVVAKNDSVTIGAYISGMFLKPSNFSKYGSVNVWLTDTINGTAHEFELFNCYGYNADTLATFVPKEGEMDLSITTNTDVTSVTGRGGVTYSVGDYVIAKGKITLYNTTYELNTGCYIISGSTAIEAVEAENEAKTAKVMKDGKFCIIKNGKAYNAAGVEIR